MKMTRLTAVTFLLIVIVDAAAVVVVAAIISTVMFAFSLQHALCRIGCSIGLNELFREVVDSFLLVE